MRELDMPWWLDAWPVDRWLPEDVKARLGAGADVCVYGGSGHLLAGFPGAHGLALDLERCVHRRACELILLIHRAFAAADPVALLAASRHALRTDGVCLVVEHFDAPELSPSARALARHLSRLGEERRGQGASEDLHRLPPPAPATPVERLVRLARAAGFGHVAPLPIEAPLLLFRLER